MADCQSQEPRGTKIHRKDGTVHVFHARCQLLRGHTGRHHNGSGDWDDDGNVWSWGRLVQRVEYEPATKLRFDSGRMALVKRPDGSTAACCAHRHRSVEAAEKCAEKLARSLVR